MARFPKKKPVNARKKAENPLERQKILDVMTELDVVAGVEGCQYALIGGALFKLMGIPGFETHDVDVASSHYLETLPIMPPMEGNPSFCPKGHHNVQGVGVDWMPNGKAGSEALFREAVRRAYLDKDGIWCAPVPIAAAIKKWAGRPQDVETVNRLIAAGVVDAETVDGLVREFCKEPQDGNA